MTIDDGLRIQQLHGLWLSGRDPVENEAEAAVFLKSVGFALRYNPSPALPLASMFKTVGDPKRAFEITNALLASREAIEINVIAERLVISHRSVVPVLYALRKRRRSSELSGNAQKAFQLIWDDGQASAGDVRRFLGATETKRPDAADLALAELQREMLIDRGPSSVPQKGVFYLSREGYPYRIFETAHADIVRTADKLKISKAVCSLIQTYLNAAAFVPLRKLAGMFKLVFDEPEMNAAIDDLVRAKTVERGDKHLIRNLSEVQQSIGL